MQQKQSVILIIRPLFSRGNGAIHLVVIMVKGRHMKEYRNCSKVNYHARMPMLDLFMDITEVL
jgi:hypothetical protein